MGNLINNEGATPISGFLGFFGGGKKTERIQLGNLGNRTTLVACKTLNADKGASDFKAQESQRSLGFFQRHVTVKTDDASYIEINIRSCAKRLGVSNEEVLKLAQASESLIFFSPNSQVPPQTPAQSQKTAENLPPYFKASDFLIIKRMAPSITAKDLQQILQYVNENKDRIITELKKYTTRDSDYVRPSKSGLERAIQFNKDGTVLIHFNRCFSQKDKILGKGGNKVVKFAWDLTNNTPIAVARIPDKEISILNQTRIGKAVDAEFEIWKKFIHEKKMHDAEGRKIKDKGITRTQKVMDEGIAELRQYTYVIGKGGVTKHLFIQPIYNQGDLRSFITKNSLPMETKKSIARQMLQSCSLLNRKGIVHLDIKPGNFLVSKTKKTDTQPESIKVDLADFGLSKITGSFKRPSGTYHYMSPESLKAITGRDLMLVSEKYDSWALGVTLFELFTGKDPSWFENVNFSENLKQGEVDSELQQIPKELRPLLKDLLKVDPEQRLTVQDALAKHNEQL